MTDADEDTAARYGDEVRHEIAEVLAATPRARGRSWRSARAIMAAPTARKLMHKPPALARISV